MKYAVQVENRPQVIIEGAHEAIREAMRYVYLADERINDGILILESGKVFTYYYGFGGVDIVPLS